MNWINTFTLNTQNVKKKMSRKRISTMICVVSKTVSSSLEEKYSHNASHKTRQFDMSQKFYSWLLNMWLITEQDYVKVKQFLYNIALVTQGHSYCTRLYYTSVLCHKHPREMIVRLLPVYSFRVITVWSSTVWVVFTHPVFQRLFTLQVNELKRHKIIISCCDKNEYLS